MVHRRDLLKSALVLASGSVASANFAATVPADGKKLLADVVKSYAAMSSYQDEGNVTSHVGDDSSYKIAFTNLYKSPALFRFRFAVPHPYPPLHDIVTNYDVGFDGAAGYFVLKRPEKPATAVPVQNLNLALARATGVSLGAAHTLSRLLVREVSGVSMLDLVNPQIGEDTTLDGTACYSLSAQHPRGGEWGLWIAMDTLLVRKLRVYSAGQNSAYSEEVHEHVRVNQPIDDGQFKPDA